MLSIDWYRSADTLWNSVMPVVMSIDWTNNTGKLIVMAEPAMKLNNCYSIQDPIKKRATWVMKSVD